MGHEDFKREHLIETSSARSFGLVFATFFLIVAFWPVLDGNAPRYWSIAVSSTLAIVAVVKPSLLDVPNYLWTRLGVVLGLVVSPIALGVLYYLVVTPIGLLIRAGRKDPLRLKMDPSAASYWIRREPPGPPPDSMHDQF